jgi:hypothetical protein
MPAILGQYFLSQLIPVAARSKVWVFWCSFARIEGSNPAGSMVNAPCYRVEVSAMDRSLVQRNLTGCGESECDREVSRRRAWHNRSCCTMGKENGPFKTSEISHPTRFHPRRLTFNRAVRTLNVADQSYRLSTDSKAHKLGVAGGDNSTGVTRLLADNVHSCSRQGVVAARLTSERPGSAMSLSQTVTPLGLHSQYQSLSKFLKRTAVRC